jgi:hypothetical protein
MRQKDGGKKIEDEDEEEDEDEGVRVDPPWRSQRRNNVGKTE